MANRDRPREWREEASAKLLEEAKPFLTGTPKVWAKRFGESVSQGEILSEMVKSRIPLGKGKFRIDRRVFHQLPLQQGMVYVAQNYAGNVPMPQDFFIKLEGFRIPRACALMPTRKAYDQWRSDLNQDRKAKEEFCQHLDEIKEKGVLGMSAPVFALKSDFNVQLAPKTTIKVPWTLQLVPLNDEVVLFMYKTKIVRNLWNNKPENCQLDEFLDLAAQMKNAIADYAYQGDVASLSVMVPTISFLAVPELADLIPEKGVEEVWNVDLTPFQTTDSKTVGDEEHQEVPKTGETKFCIHCGEKIAALAKFCPACGQEQ